MPLPVIDTHCHYFSATAPEDARRLIATARSRGLAQALICSASIGELRSTAEAALCEGFAFALGVHPFDAHNPLEEALGQLEDEIGRRRGEPLFAAVGEIGLDFRQSVLADLARTAQISLSEAKSRQTALFIGQLTVARRLDLPVSVHAVHAAGALVSTLQSVPGVRGIIHAYTGSLETARVLTALGFKLGFGGALTYPAAKRLRSVFAALDDTDWVLETDAPWMPAYDRRARQRKTRSEPADIALVLEAAAALRGQTPQEAARQARWNTLQILPALA
ncbi:MAG: TatD family hydrolase [Duodenibacillus sp.]